jgi:uncharacterized protein
MLTRYVRFSGAASGAEDAPMLEGHLTLHDDGSSHPGVVICHSNPAAGGHMDTTLIQVLAETLAAAGFATLRYNSRGVGESEGQITQVEAKRIVVPEGEPEMLDVGAALRFLAGQAGVNGERLGLAGHSFGARISLAYLANHPDERSVRAVACVGLAVAWRDLSYLGNWPHPKLFVTGERDDFSPPELLRDFVAGLPEPANLVVLRNTGHFFEGREEDLADTLTAFFRQVLA